MKVTIYREHELPFTLVGVDSWEVSDRGALTVYDAKGKGPIVSVAAGKWSTIARERLDGEAE